MLNARNSIWVALLIAVLICWGSEAVAQTSVHGYAIPTADGPRTPSIAVCGSTSNPIEDGRRGRAADRRMSGLDNRRYTASVCLPVRGDTGPRGFSVPVDVAEAIETIEYSLAAHFEHDSANFDDVEALPAMDVIVSWLASTPEAGLLLQGHTDSTGEAAYNLQLAYRRVEAVKSLFVERGVAAERIRAEWFGENNLLLTALGRQRENRRVDIKVYQIVEGEVLEEFVPPVPVEASIVTEVPDTQVSDTE